MGRHTAEDNGKVSFWLGTEEAERFAQHAFDKVIGRTLPLKLGDRQVGTVIIVAATVAHDGNGAWLLCEAHFEGVLHLYAKHFSPDPDVHIPLASIRKWETLK
jgi:hypothetical protein